MRARRPLILAFGLMGVAALVVVLADDAAPAFVSDPRWRWTLASLLGVLVVVAVVLSVRCGS